MRALVILSRSLILQSVCVIFGEEKLAAFSSQTSRCFREFSLRVTRVTQIATEGSREGGKEGAVAAAFKVS